MVAITMRLFASALVAAIVVAVCSIGTPSCRRESGGCLPGCPVGLSWLCPELFLGLWDNVRRAVGAGPYRWQASHRPCQRTGAPLRPAVQTGRRPCLPPIAEMCKTHPRFFFFFHFYRFSCWFVSPSIPKSLLADAAEAALCSGTETLTGVTGNFATSTPWSGEYENNMECTWEVAPVPDDPSDAKKFLEIRFTRFDIEEGYDDVR